MSATDQEWDGRLVDWGRFFVDALATLGSTTEYGFVADDQSGDQGPTALEQKLGSWPFRWADSRLLRQYAWMTYLAPSALDMVGGVRTIRETGSFETVLELDCGGVVVVATKVPSQYDSDAVFRVFRALAPALPAGELYAPQAYVPPYKLVYEDAAVYGGKRMDAGPHV